MARQCPECGSFSVRRSGTHEGGGVLGALGVRSPYRCRECGIVFRVVSRKFHLFAGLLAAVAIGWALLWLLYGMMFQSFLQQVPLPPS